MKTAERELLDDAIAALICALAYDEAEQHGADEAELRQLRTWWVDDAERIVEVADRCGLLLTEDEENEE